MILHGFPRRTLRGDLSLYRIHRASRDGWWFSADGSGRFDPVGSGMGACYLAYKPLGAWVEVFRKGMLLAEDDVRERALMTVQLGRDLRLADLTSRRVLSYGMTAAVGAGEDYAASHAFAVAALDAGFAGVRYLVRHDPAQRHYGVALFAPAGAPDPGDPAWPGDVDAAIPDALVEEAARAFKYPVLPAP